MSKVSAAGAWLFSSPTMLPTLSRLLENPVVLLTTSDFSDTLTVGLLTFLTSNYQDFTPERSTLVFIGAQPNYTASLSRVGPSLPGLT